MSFQKLKPFVLQHFFGVLLICAVFISQISCKETTEDTPAFAKAEKEKIIETPTSIEDRALSQEWQEYWYDGKAEITSYQLSQSRYGELRNGTAALIYVTEDFLPEEQVKANRQSDNTIPILKLNTSKKFITGIYPYSVMNSTFYPVKAKKHALKITQSIQEWCGHVYMQLNNKAEFEIESHSYFEGESDQTESLEKTILENELWTQLRLNPQELPVGKLKIIPGFEFLRMRHAKLKAYKAIATLKESEYSIVYPQINRTLTIEFAPLFPHVIQGWTETYQDTRGGELMTTTATKINTIKNDYWNNKRVSDEYMRENLGL